MKNDGIIWKEYEIKINDVFYKGIKIDKIDSYNIDESEIFIEIFVKKTDENILDLIDEASYNYRIEENKRIDKIRWTWKSLSWKPFYENDLRLIKDYSCPSLNVEIWEDIKWNYIIVALSKRKMLDNWFMVILKIEETNELYTELYISKWLWECERMAKLHYLSERLVSYLYGEWATRYFNYNLDKLDILEEEKSLLKSIKMITWCFAHWNTTTIEQKEDLKWYYNSFYSLMEELIKKYTC